jgi:hypothetical protein
MNMVLFMLAGYETTSTTLTYCTYVLATHPDEQQKLYDEIYTHFGNEESIDFDSVKDLQYLEMFLKEVLRMYPIANLYAKFKLNFRTYHFYNVLFLKCRIKTMHKTNTNQRFTLGDTIEHGDSRRCYVIAL